jgi:hypothetical protein
MGLAFSFSGNRRERMPGFNDQHMKFAVQGMRGGGRAGPKQMKV